MGRPPFHERSRPVILVTQGDPGSDQGALTHTPLKFKVWCGKAAFLVNSLSVVEYGFAFWAPQSGTPRAALSART